MNELALFAGAGGGILGGHLLGWRTICAVEREPYAASVLLARQNDGILPPFPIWDDVCTFDGKPWRGLVDVVSGGFPCQDISAAGKGAGIDGERSGLWREMARIIGEVRPRFVFVENSPILVSRGLAVVISDLAEMGYGAEWFCLSASDCGAPHKRDRIWIVASDTEREPLRDKTVENVESEKPERKEFGVHGCDWHVADANHSERGPQLEACGRVAGEIGLPQGEEGSGGPSASGETGKCRTVADPDRVRELQPKGRKQDERRRAGHGCESVSWQSWPAEPGVGRVADGVAARVDRLKAIGNGQVPRVAATAFNMMVDLSK